MIFCLAVLVVLNATIKQYECLDFKNSIITEITCKNEELNKYECLLYDFNHEFFNCTNNKNCDTSSSIEYSLPTIIYNI